MSPNYFPILENKRVLLRPLQEEDILLLWPLIEEQKDIFRWMTASIESQQDLELFIQKAVEDRDSKRSIPFTIIDKQRNEIAGSTRFGNIEWAHKRVEIGWTWLAPKYQATGINKAMKFLMLQYAFEILACNRVEIKTNELNKPSRKAIESIGAKYEGTLRSHIINSDGTVRNTVYYSIIKEEWEDVKTNLLRKYGSNW